MAQYPGSSAQAGWGRARLGFLRGHGGPGESEAGFRGLAFRKRAGLQLCITAYSPGGGLPFGDKGLDTPCHSLSPDTLPSSDPGAKALLVDTSWDSENLLVPSLLPSFFAVPGFLAVRTEKHSPGLALSDKFRASSESPELPQDCPVRSESMWHVGSQHSTGRAYLLVYSVVLQYGREQRKMKIQEAQMSGRRGFHAVGEFQCSGSPVEQSQVLSPSLTCV